MAFIEKKDPVVLNIMLTSKGREQLSAGNLTFSYFAVGDSEIDYNFIREVNAEVDPDYNPFDSSILRPRDKNPQIISFIPRNSTGATSGDSLNELGTISPISYDVINKQDTLGFFTNSGTTFITDSIHVKQPDVMINMPDVVGGTSLKLKKSPTYGAIVTEPAVGDLLLVRWTFGGDTTSYNIDINKPSPYLMYQITGITSGTLAGDDLIVGVDRELPDFTSTGAVGRSGVLVYYSSITTTHLYATDYLTESVLDFIQNYQCGIENFPYWNMSIIFTEEIAGIQIADRKFGQFKTRTYGGFVSYIQNQAPIYKKLGVIHYTNNSPANTYGEEFNLNTPTLDIPTIMWHKSTGTTLGVRLNAIGSKKILTGETKSLNIDYYDLADPNGIVVGKVFTGLKLFVIEDQELLFAMSYKSNRSWTLPNYILGSGGSPCDDTVVIVTPPPPPPPPNIVTYGRSYNWFAAADPRIAMAGWCVPTYDEWRIMADSLPSTCYSGPSTYSETISMASQYLKSTGNTDNGGLWMPSAYGGLNQYGMNIKPGGIVQSNGLSGAVGQTQYADFWTKDQNPNVSTKGSYWNFGYNGNNMYSCRQQYDKHYGFSIRLIQIQGSNGGICATSYSDYEQNVYPVTRICVGGYDRVWLADNLRTLCYNDGTAIPSLTGNTWSITCSGAVYTCV